MPDRENTGQAVWLHYDQAGLNDQYEQRVLVPHADQYLAREAEESALVRETLRCRLDVNYGPTKEETLDIFPADGEGNPALVYLHGGAWTRSDKRGNSYQAPAFVGAGVSFLSVNFGLAPAVSMDELVRRCRAAVHWVHENTESFGSDRNRLFVAGHSSGAHLAAMVAVTDWAADWGLPADTVKGVIAASGMYDLEPVRLSARNEYLHLDRAATERNSPACHIRKGMPPMIVACGEKEQVEFRRHAVDFTYALRKDGHGCVSLDLPGQNHFDVGEALADLDSPLYKAAIELMKV